MRYPNLRYGNPTAMAHYAIWYGDTRTLAKALRRSERSVRDWLSGAARVPFWVPELMRLQKMEHDLMVYQMTGQRVSASLGIVQASAAILAHQRRPPDAEKPQVSGGPGLFDDVDQPRTATG